MMKDIGIVRTVDELGRITLPNELRRQLGIREKENLSIIVDEEQNIILKKLSASCTFCGKTEGLMNYKGKNLSTGCKDDMKNR